MTIWLDEFTRHTWDPYGFGYACAYRNGEPWPITKHGRSRGLIHSTETRGLPGYGGGRMNPNATIDPWAKRRWQHVPFDIAARATAANNHQYVQFEIVGYCDRSNGRKYGHYLEDMGKDELEYIAESLALVGAALDVPTSSGVTWKSYPSSYGSNGVRLSQRQLLRYEGWLGHQHAPYPDNHGDPGHWPHSHNLFGAMTGAGGGGSHAPVSPPDPTEGDRIEVDGYFGPATTRLAQKIAGSAVDGVISDQPITIKEGAQVAVTLETCWPTIDYDRSRRPAGSALVMAYQHAAGVEADGYLGPITRRALQHMAGVKADGLPGFNTVKALQRRLNEGEL